VSLRPESLVFRQHSALFTRRPPLPRPYLPPPPPPLAPSATLVLLPPTSSPSRTRRTPPATAHPPSPSSTPPDPPPPPHPPEPRPPPPPPTPSAPHPDSPPCPTRPRPYPSPPTPLPTPPNPASLPLRPDSLSSPSRDPPLLTRSASVGGPRSTPPATPDFPCPPHRPVPPFRFSRFLPSSLCSLPPFAPFALSPPPSSIRPLRDLSLFHTCVDVCSPFFGSLPPPIPPDPHPAEPLFPPLSPSPFTRYPDFPTSRPLPPRRQSRLRASPAIFLLSSFLSLLIVILISFRFPLPFLFYRLSFSRLSITPISSFDVRPPIFVFRFLDPFCCSTCIRCHFSDFPPIFLLRPRRATFSSDFPPFAPRRPLPTPPSGFFVFSGFSRHPIFLTF
jgi:hypothetical protein